MGVDHVEFIYDAKNTIRYANYFIFVKNYQICVTWIAKIDVMFAIMKKNIHVAPLCIGF